MRSKSGWRRVTGPGAALALLAVSTTTQAQSIEALRGQLRQMQEQMEQLNQKIERMEEEQAKAETEGVKFHPGKLQIESADGQHSIRAGGRIMVDGALYDEDTNADLGSGTEFRRARLFVEGKLWKYWKYKGQYDFADDSVEIKDAYIRNTYFDPTTLTVGQFKEPFSLEELTSSKYITFMERALPNAFAPGRSVGFGAHTEGALGERGGWSAAAGVFGGNSADAEGGNVTESTGVTGRVTVAPIAEEGRVLHVGGSASWRDPNQEDTIRFRERPESHHTGVRLVDTGTFAAEDFTRYGVEAAAVFGPASLQGEYIVVDVDAPASGDPAFHGWYVYGSYFLTGESRPYDAGAGNSGGSSPRAASPAGASVPGRREFGSRASISPTGSSSAARRKI